MGRTGKVVLLCVLAGIVGIVLFAAIAFVQSYIGNIGEPKIYSDHEAREAYAQKRQEIAAMIESHFDIAVPENAEDLYFSHCGSIMGYEQYAAFRLGSEDECLAFFEQEQVNPNKFQKSKLTSEVLWSRYYMPHKWEEQLQDSNWRLSSDDEILYGGIGDSDMIYDSDEHRLYLFWEAGP